jgi:hypothetical protein
MNVYVVLILIFLFLVFIFALYAFAKSIFVKKLNSADMVYVKGHWADIMNNIDEDASKAILDADKILDYVLARHGFSGSLGEKLKTSAYKFSDLNGIWNAHKLRNKLAHEFEEADEDEVKKALKQYKRAFKDLGVKF